MLMAGFIFLAKSDKAEPVQNDNSDELKLVEKEFTKIDSTEDKELIHKLFAGAGIYLSKCQVMVNTSQFDPILGRVQSSYGWERDKYSDFTDAVSDYLVSVEYDIPKDLKTNQEIVAAAGEAAATLRAAWLARLSLSPTFNTKVFA